ncbi:MAG TPA: alpha-amylase family glycosyl hydrolase [Candidatus Microsaccharimonas sp.]|nr:alpha-amylase family glycosyl hydrolase [Candidatus Microsaccharimonas sp.]
MKSISQTKKHARQRWPEGAIVYQIYPRSFYDSNADGIGDIPGIIQKLDYLKNLEVNVIWLSPFYPSPMADFGYDVADYRDVDPIFGTLDDMDRLIEAAHRRNIKLFADLVPNHTSDQHEWFKESKKSREGKFADWYIWRDPLGWNKKDQPIVPNNWIDLFSGETVWEWEPARQQFYMHTFDVHQPDLDWTNPEVREAFKDIMRFWLDRGIDGFRVDAISFMSKDPELRDEPKNPHYSDEVGWKYLALEHIYSMNGPKLFDYLSEMAAVLDEEKYQKSLRFMVTEAYPQTHEHVKEYLGFYKGMNPKVAAPFNFESFSLPWEAEPWRKFLHEFHQALDIFSPLAISSYAFGNHDQTRLATRMGDTAARGVAVFLLTLPGMVFIYNGDEIGMRNGKIPPEMVQDPSAAGDEGRDPERTPLQWSAAKNAGFTTADTPWLPVSEDYQTNNIASQTRDPSSCLTLYKQLTRLRNSSDVLRHGSFAVVQTGNESILGFVRLKDGKGYLTLLSFSPQIEEVKIPADTKITRFKLSSDAETKHKKSSNNIVHLLPNEAAIFVVKIV